MEIVIQDLELLRRKSVKELAEFIKLLFEIGF